MSNPIDFYFDFSSPYGYFAAMKIDAFAGRQIIGTVTLTMSNKAQKAAADALGGRRGTVVVLDVQTGGIVAAYSNPTFDPNGLASHDVKKAQRIRTLYLLDPTQPLLARSWREVYPPGSTFKTVTASIAIQGNVDVTKQFPFLTELPLPQTVRRIAENEALPHELRHMVAVLTTGFVLFTLLVNGLSLQGLVRLLGLDRLPPAEQATSTRRSRRAPGRRKARSRTTSRRSPKAPSANATCSSRRSRWRSRPSRSRRAASCSNRT